MAGNISHFVDPSGKTIYYYKWTSSYKPVAAFQVVHGMAEHAARYNDFALKLAQNNIVVYANDHRGHGLTAETLEETGYLADTHGWDIATSNVYQLTKIIKKKNPGIPIIMLGHSMGSLIARNYINFIPNDLSGLILSGTSYTPSLLLQFGKAVAVFQKLFFGKKHSSRLLDTLSFGKFNQSFKPNRTKFDWLSRDPEQVDKYVNDAYCGFICTTQFYSDLFIGILQIQKKSFLDKTPKNIPILIISGEKDPVGNFTKGVDKVHKIYKIQGVKDISKIIFKDARHEILNETNRADVYAQILIWVNSHI